MRNIEDIYGKRLKFTAAGLGYRRFPGSDSIKMYATGAVSEPIDSYIQGKYFAVKGAAELIYIEDVPGVEVVSADEQSNAGMLSSAVAWLKSGVVNAQTAVQKNTGFIKSGFKKSVTDLGKSFESGGVTIFKDIRITLIILIVLSFVYVMFNFFRK